MTETWKSIPEFPGYEVSDCGRVRSFFRKHTYHSWCISDFPQRILKPSYDHSYLGVSLRRNGHSHRFRIHKLIMLAFVGPCPKGMEVCHNDGNPQNNHLDNLRYDSHAENMKDRVMFTDKQILATRVSPELYAYIKTEAKDKGVGRAAVLRWALRAYFDDQPEKQRIKEPLAPQ